MKLTIVSVDITDFGIYKCVAKNSLGETDGSIKLYRKYSLEYLIKFQRNIETQIFAANNKK